MGITGNPLQFQNLKFAAEKNGGFINGIGGVVG
jgi:hypothetical protein